MIRTKAVVLSATLALAVGLSIGCTHAQKGAAAGGVIGAVVGAAAGHNSASVTTGQGAALGGAGGLATGGLAGDAFAEVDRQDLERELENLTAQLQEAEDELLALQNSGLTSEKLAQLEDLQNRMQDTQSELESKRAALDDLQAQLAESNADLSQKEAALAELRGAQAEASTLSQQIDQMDQELQSAVVERDEAVARSERMEENLKAAQDQLARLNGQLDVVQTSLREKGQAVDNLRSEMEALNIELEETARGLTLTIMNELLYEPGQAVLSDSGKELLGKVSNIINTNFPGRELVVEGHTDNQPIVHSHWASNWELGAARALSVVHEMVEVHGFDANKLSATSFGEHRPAASNSTAVGRAANRRAVIVILPEKLAVQRNQFANL